MKEDSIEPYCLKVGDFSLGLISATFLNFYSTPVKIEAEADMGQHYGYYYCVFLNYLYSSVYFYSNKCH